MSTAPATHLFAICQRGLGPLVGRELGGLPGVQIADAGYDGRADVVRFDAEDIDRVMRLRTTDDIFVEVGRTQRADYDRSAWIANRIWRAERAHKALQVWADTVRPLSASMTFRVIARVRQEQSFLRTDLRRDLSRAIGNYRPKWRFADPAQLEVWINEYRAGRFVAGVRLTDARMRQHAGREVERPGALRPTVAAAMVDLAGPCPDAGSGVLLDPCCGSGTILDEAVAVGWTAQGLDIDPAAVTIARINAPRATTQLGDVRQIDRPDESVAACVTNLPFGQQYDVPGDMTAWLRIAVGELTRVTRPGGRIVVLAPEIPRCAVPSELRSTQRFALRLLGTRTAIWTFDRT